MKFVLSFLLVFLCVFATAQVPPMVIGGPQGISSKKVLAEQWLSIPVMVDTPAAPLTGAPWPEKGYIVHVTKANDTTVWHYTGKRWQRIGGAAENRYTELIGGGKFSRNPSLNRFTVGASTYYIEGKYYSSSITQINGFTKTPNSNGRIDIVALEAAGPIIIQGTESANPISPIVAANRIKLGFVYYPPFDSLPTISGNGIEAIFRRPGVDSIFFSTSDTTLSIKDSIGISKNDTASMLNPYKFTAANGLTKDSTVFRLGGSLNQNTNINLNTRRLTLIGGNDTTRFFANGSVNIGGAATDSTYKLNVNGNARVGGILRLQPQSPTNSAVILNQNSSDGSIAWGGSLLSLNASIGARNTIISPAGTFSNLTGGQNTIIGRNVSSLTSGSQNVLLGTNAGSLLTTGSNNTIIGFGDGHNYSSSTSNAIHIVAGGGYESNRGDTVLLGLSSGYAIIGGGFGSGSYVSDFYFGAGHRVRFPNLTHVNFYAPSGFPTKADTIGSNFTINAGRGTGQGIGGSVIFRTSDTTATGTTLQTLTERVRITPRGNMLVGTSADSLFRLDVNGRVRLRDTLTLSTTPVTADTSANDLLVINSSNGQVRRYTGDWYSVPLSGSATLDFGNTSAQNSADLTITVTGAASGDVVSLGVPNGSVNANTCFTAWVSATDTVTVRFNNYSSGAVDPASGTFKIKVLK